MTLDEIMAPIRAGRKDLLPVLRSVLQRNPNLWKEQGDEPAGRLAPGLFVFQITMN